MTDLSVVESIYFAALAHHAWNARDLLDKHRPKPGENDLRGFEWHYLSCLFHGDVLAVKALGAQSRRLPTLRMGKGSSLADIVRHPDLSQRDTSGTNPVR